MTKGPLTKGHLFHYTCVCLPYGITVMSNEIPALSSAHEGKNVCETSSPGIFPPNATVSTLEFRALSRSLTPTLFNPSCTPPPFFFCVS
ncbi:hypothetical protein CDAR_500901 [Caerostris darwini]|uniref:Uncharacterized protein n=1 Tax=Caerostris darwini TaxID=1538125 RepID=A0AAV4NIU9_9ARAC|nr:hypothetical protein CDAR_500901 [Caerostris darwini]